MVSLIAGLLPPASLPTVSAELFSKGRGFGEVVGGKSLICLASRVVLLNVYKSPELAKHYHPNLQTRL